MRQSSDKGFSPNTRYDRAPKRKGTSMSNADIIRVFADYCKDRKIERSIILIDGKPDMTYPIRKEELAHDINGEWIRVRRYSGDMSKVYLFDIETDTYLGAVEAHLDVAGDLASKTDEENLRIGTHVAAKKRNKKFRQAKLAEANAYIEAAEKLELPEAIKAPHMDLSPKCEEIRVLAIESESKKRIEVEALPEPFSEDSDTGKRVDVVSVLESATEREPLIEEVSFEYT